ncbi:phage minor head protein [Campylobacter geochelonis]|uniref:Putative prophage MuSo1, F protein n=1 Tax=Campylobacter geochelonis TaxID=1780362 RepID=A0A128EIW7_9BACT|nr:phage minor head protein [Campylobacter geochelonis]QKF71174.1 phage Mu protein F-like protein [Campylobacter geochelonis]CZE48511.1 putative prophage MuSo1%2C F protein [Campylobacter geochelonis]
MESFGEYFRYTAVLDNRTRKSHARLHGTILPKTDKFWDRNYPPNGWGCRCSVQVLTKKEIQKRGLTPLADSSMLKDISDKAFAYNPKVDRLDSILKDKAKKLGCNDVKANGGGLKFNSPCDKVKEFEKQREAYLQERFANMASKKLQNMFSGIDLLASGYKPPLEKPLVLSILSDNSIKNLSNHGYIASKFLKVFTQAKLLHGFRQKKILDGNALTKEQFLNMPKFLTDDNLYLGLDEFGEKEIKFYWFDNNQEDRMCYAYFKNGLITYGVTNIENYRGNLKNKKLIKIKP